MGVKVDSLTQVGYLRIITTLDANVEYTIGIK